MCKLMTQQEVHLKQQVCPPERSVTARPRDEDCRFPTKSCLSPPGVSLFGQVRGVPQHFGQEQRGLHHLQAGDGEGEPPAGQTLTMNQCRFPVHSSLFFLSNLDDKKDQKAGEGDGHVPLQVGEQQQGSRGDGRGGTEHSAPSCHFSTVAAMLQAVLQHLKIEGNIVHHYHVVLIRTCLS